MTYQIKRGSQIIVETEINGTHTREAPAVDNIQVQFTLPESIILDKGDTLLYDNQTYSLVNYSSKKNALHNYDYTAQFESISYRATEILCLGYDSENNLTLPVYPINADINTLIDLCLANLNRLDSGWTKGQLSISTPEYFEIENKSVMAVLAEMSGTFNMPFDIQNKVINFGITTNETNLQYEYGLGKGFTSILDRTDPNKSIINVLYASGSTENLPSGYGKRRLTIEPLINQASIDKYGRLEGSVINDNIRPTTKGKILEVVAYQNAVLDSDVGTISYKTDLPLFAQYRRGVMNIISGIHNGQSFPIEVTRSEDQTYQIVTYFKTGLRISDLLKPETGEEFTLTEINMDAEFVTAAENRLREFAQGFLNEVSQKMTEIDCECDPLIDFSGIKINDTIKIVDVNLGIDSKFIVIGITRPLQKFQPTKLKLSVKGRVYTNLSLPSGQNTTIQQGAINNGIVSEFGRVKFDSAEIGGFIIEGDRIVSKNGALELLGVEGAIKINYQNGNNGIFIGINEVGDPVYRVMGSNGVGRFEFNQDGIIFADFRPESYTSMGDFVFLDDAVPWNEFSFTESARLQTKYTDASCSIEVYTNPPGVFPPELHITTCGAAALTSSLDNISLFTYESGWSTTSAEYKQYEAYVFVSRNKLGDRVPDGWYYRETTNNVFYGQQSFQNTDGSYSSIDIPDTDKRGKIVFMRFEDGEHKETKEVNVQFLLSNDTNSNEINEQPIWNVIN